jgi:hypothetical protein
VHAPGIIFVNPCSVNLVVKFSKKTPLELYVNIFNEHKTSPLILYGNKKRLLFIGGNDKLVDLIRIIEKNEKNITDKVKELYGGNDIISDLIYSLQKLKI